MMRLRELFSQHPRTERSMEKSVSEEWGKSLTCALFPSLSRVSGLLDHFYFVGGHLTCSEGNVRQGECARVLEGIKESWPARKTLLICLSSAHVLAIAEKHWLAPSSGRSLKLMVTFDWRTYSNSRQRKTHFNETLPQVGWILSYELKSSQNAARALLICKFW